MKCALVVAFLASVPFFVDGLTCMTCNQGYQAKNSCSFYLPSNMVEVCSNPTDRCLEAVEWFANGALKMVRRTCARPDFCTNYPGTGELKSCRLCDQHVCNNKTIYEPISSCA